MADSPLTTKAGLSVGDFKAGISEMNRDLRVLSSEFKASAAAIGDWSKDATGLESRISFLNKSIDIQKQKVEALKGQMALMKEEGKLTASAEAEMTIKINKATEELNKMTREVNEDQTALDGMKNASAETGEAVAGMGEEAANTTDNLETMKTGWAALFTGLQAGLGVILAVVGALIAVSGALAGLVFSTASASAELNDLSLKTGVSVERLQELAYVGDQVGTSQETMVSALTKLTRSMSDAGEQSDDFAKKQSDAAAEGKAFEGQLGDQADAFKSLGISVTDSSGQLRDNEAVFSEVIDALGRIPNEVERDALAMKLFGKSAQELNPLIKAGSAELAALAQEARDIGAVMSEENVQAFADFQDGVDSLKAGFGGIQAQLAGAVLPLFIYLAAALKEAFNSPEFKAGLKAAVDGLKSITTWAITNIPLIAQTVKNLMPVIVGVLAAIGAAIIAFVYTTVIPAAAASLAAMTPIIVAMLPIIAIVAAIGLAVGLLYAAWTNNWGGIQDKFAAVWGFLQPIFAAIAEWMEKNIPAAISVVSAYWTGTLYPAILKVGTWMSTYLFPLFKAIAAFIGAVFGVALKALAVLWENVLYPAIQSVANVISQTLQPVFDDISTFIVDDFMPAFDDLGDLVNDTIVAGFNSLAKTIEGVIAWINKMVDLLDSVTMPDWMSNPGATSFALNFSGDLASEMQKLNQEIALTATPGATRSQSGLSQAKEEHFHFTNYGTLNFATDAPGGLQELMTASRY